MNRVLILVEGQTEETFVREVLSHHLSSYGVHPIPVIVATKRIKSGAKFKGGVGQYSQIRDDLRRLLNDTGAAGVTTMLDYYGIPRDTPGFVTSSATESRSRVRQIERAIEQDIGMLRSHAPFKAFLVLHEYEGLLFSEPAQIAATLPESGILEELLAIRAKFSSPEEIDEGEETHPSARIARLAPGYQKPFHGVLIALAIGLTSMRSVCPHFNQWVDWLESLS
jgi:hypothetical protein